MHNQRAPTATKKRGLLGRFKKTKPEAEVPSSKKPISLYGPSRPAAKAAPVVKGSPAAAARRTPAAQPRAPPPPQPPPSSGSRPAPPRASALPVARRQQAPPPLPRPVPARAQQRSSAQAPPPAARRRPGGGTRRTVKVQPAATAPPPPPPPPPKSAPAPPSSTTASRALAPPSRAAHPRHARPSISDQPRGDNPKPLLDPDQIRSIEAELAAQAADDSTTNEHVDEPEQEPAPIEGSAGSRVRVVLGSRGSDFLLLLEEEDGTRTWQSQHWSSNSGGGIPPGLDAQLRKVDLVHQCSFSQSDWFLSAREAATGQTKSWWNVSSAEFHRGLQAAAKSGLQVRVVFGDPALHQYVILLGTNGYTLGQNLPPQLLDAMDKVYEAESTIARIRGLNGNGRFLLEENILEEDEEGDGDEDEEGIVRICYHSNGLSPYLTEALKQSLEDASDLHEISMGVLDKSWLIIRDGAHESSVGVNDELIQLLEAFYQRHKERQEAREHEIALFRKEQRLRGQQGDLAAAEACREKQKEEAAVAEARRLARKEHVKEIWATARKRRGKEDRITEISTKGLKKGDQVTALGISMEPGDATIVDINRQEGYVVVSRESDKEKECMTETVIQDPRRVSKHKDNNGEFDERSGLFQLAVAEDKFEAAILMYHSHIRSNTCPCKTDLIGYSQRFVWPNPWQPGDEVHVTGYANGVVIASDPKYSHNPYLVHVEYKDGSSYHVPADQVQAVSCCMSPECCEFQMATREADEIALRIRPLFECMEPNPDVVIFDEYKCAEKIDLRRLQRLADNLRLDCDERRNCMNEIVERLDECPEDEDNWEYEEYFRKLERCYDFEETVYTFYDLFKGQPVDEQGFLVHQMQYRHKDASCRGRLFALGRPVRVLEEKFPRTLTLQGVQAELWPPLAGAFAHNIDCENSDIRLLCSLARQLGLESTIPSITDFCNNRSVWLNAIQQEHPTIPAQEIKRLPNIILNGGTYETWVKEVAADCAVTKVSRFGFRIFAEVETFRDQVLRHPRFQWIERERAVLENEHVSGEAANVVLFMRILQACENKVLGILHRTFHNHGCWVRSKVFDGLLVELGDEAIDAGTTLEDIMDRAEEACETQGWDVHLVEKPLQGLQDYSIPCVEEAREVVEAWFAGKSQHSDEKSSFSLDDQDDEHEASIEESDSEEEEAEEEKSANEQAGERLLPVGSTSSGASQAQQTFGSSIEEEEEVEDSDSTEVDDDDDDDDDSSLEYGSSINEYSEVTETEYTEVAATVVTEYTELIVQSNV